MSPVDGGRFMDCQTARLLLPFLNPRAEQLPAEVAQSLEAHAHQCATCSGELQNSGREDRIVALAMKNVEVPSDLRQRIFTRLRSERIRRRRNWPVRHPRWAAAAALLFFCLAGALGYWWQRPLPGVDMRALEDASSLAGSPDQLRALFEERGIRAEPPHFFRFNFLVSCGWELFQGKLVPRLLFEGNSGQIAEVFILNKKQFDLDATPPGSANIMLLRDPGDDNVAYVIRYANGLPDWLFNHAPGA
jgi:hypothetical protein